MRQTDIGPLFRRTGAIGLDWIGLFCRCRWQLASSGEVGLGSPPVRFCLFREHGNGRPRGAVMVERPPSGLLCKNRHAARSVVGGWPHIEDQARCVAPVMVGCGMWDVGEDAGCVWLMLAPIGGRLGRPFAGLLQAICAEMRWLGNWQVETLSALPCGAGQGFQSGRVPGSAIRQQLPGQVGAGMNPSSVPRDGVFVCSCTLIPSSLFLIQP